MLDRLGLGIVLTMKDDFTPKANKAVESMDRFASKADIMQKEVQQSMNNLQNVMLAGFSLGQVGGDLERAGKKAIGVFKNIGAEIVNVNANFETKRSQLLTAFKGDVKETEKAFDWIRKFAEVTPFETEGLTDAFSKMKSTGMDLRKEFTLANGQVKTLAEGIADLSSRNMGATGGPSNLAYAIQNAWAGQARSLYQRFNFAKQEMDGMMQWSGGGKTPDIDKFMEEFIKLSQRLAPDAMKNMEGTWQQVVANMGEAWSNFVYDIGVAGVFKPMVKTLESLRRAMETVTDNKDTVKNFGSLISSLWKPFDKFVVGLANVVAKMVTFLGQRPALAKFISGFTLFSGVMLVLSGTIMKLTGGFLILTTSIVSAYANLKVLDTFGKIDMFSKLGVRVGGITKAFTGLTIGAGIFALAYKRNLGGTKDATDKFVKGWNDSGEALKNGVTNNAIDISATYLGEMNKVTRGLTQARGVVGLLFKSVFGKRTNGELNLTSVELRNINALGLRPMQKHLEKIRERVVAFTKGFSKGIETAYHVAKQFLDFALIPIKAVMEALSNFPPIKAFKSLFGDDEQSTLTNIEKVGKVVGGLTGAFLGLKAVSSITSVITAPFKKLFESTRKSTGEVRNLRREMSKLDRINPMKRIRMSSSSTGSQIDAQGNVVGDYNSIMGRQYRYRTRYGRAKTHFNDYLDRDNPMPTGRAQSSTKGFSEVGRDGIPRKYERYILPEHLRNSSEQIYTKNRGSLGEKLFGTKYYTKGPDGLMNKIGQHGGKLRREVDDRQLRLSLEKRGPVRKPDYRDLYTIYGGDLEHLKSDRRNFIGTNKPHTSISGLKGNPLEEHNNYAQNIRDNMFNNKDFRAKAFKNSGVSGRMFNGMDLIRDPAKRARKEAERMAIFEAEAQRQQFPNHMDGKEVFKSNRRGVRRALFGDKYYTPEMGRNGQMYERTVARSGGLFRRSSNDMRYRDEGDPTRNIFTRGKDKAGSVIGKIGGRISEGITKSKGWIGNSILAQNLVRARTSVTDKVQSMGRVPLGFINKQRSRLGMDSIDSYEGSDGLMSRMGNQLFKQPKLDADGNLLAKGGILSKVGKGMKNLYMNFEGLATSGGILGKGGALVTGISKTLFQGAKGIGGVVAKGAKFAGRGVLGAGRLVGRGVGAVGRGVGAVGRGVVRSLPMIAGGVALGKAGYEAIKAKGDGDFKKGVKMLEEQVKSINFGEAFKNFSSSFKENINLLKPVAKTVFTEIGKILPDVMKEAWAGIKTMAKLSWEFIKEHGVTIMKGTWEVIKFLAGEAWTGIKYLAGEAWTWIKTDGVALLGDFWGWIKTKGGETWTWFKTDGVEKIKNLITSAVSWMITDGVPKMINALKNIGIWLLTEGGPKLISDMAGIALSMGTALFTGIMNGLGDIGTAIYNKITEGLNRGIEAVRGWNKSGFSTTDFTPRSQLGKNGMAVQRGSVTKNSGYSIVQRKSHGGLWLSPDEHNATLLKDETVLPVDKSRRLDALLDDVSLRGKKEPQQIDNSIHIDKIELVVKADKISQTDARQQAKMILEEFKKLQKEKNIRQYS